MKEQMINGKKVVVFDGHDFDQDDGFYFQVEAGQNSFGPANGPYDTEDEALAAALAAAK